MDRMGAWGGSVAHRFDLEDKVGKLGESSGKVIGGHGAESVSGVTPQVQTEEHPAPAIAQASAEPEEAKETPDAEGGEALPYWPSLLPEFEHASQDFGYMRKVAVEFKKSQIEGKQKAVNTLAVYGRYKEYAQARAAAAAKNQQGAQQTGAATQQNVAHASQTEGQAGQGEAKQAQAKGAANDKAATDLPEPASTGFVKQLANEARELPANSNGVAPSIANAAKNITAANDVLAVKNFRLEGTARTIELKPEEEATWPVQVATFLSGEMGINPGRIKADPITDGKSGTPVFHVRVGVEELGYLKIFSDPVEAKTEIAMLKRIAAKQSKIPDMEVVGEKGTIDVAGDGKTKTGLLMSTADGTSVDGMIKNLPAEGNARETAIGLLRQACVKVARGLSEMHAAFADGKNQSSAQKNTDIDYIFEKLDQIRGKLGDAHYSRIKNAMNTNVVPKYMDADVPATNYHGDANVGNFVVGNDGKLQMIDVGSMKWSIGKDGAPTGTGAADVGRFLESLQSKHPGALSPNC